MALSSKEIDQLIKKLREKYKESAVKYKSRLFNLDAFEDRFQTALRKRMNLEAFILSEITNYEKIKRKIIEDMNPKRNEESEFSKQVDSIMQENIARIKKYDEIRFHQNAHIEIARLYGALSDFILHYFNIFWIIISDPQIKDVLYNLDTRFSDFAVSKSSRHPKRIEDHILVLSRSSSKEIDIEKNKNQYLKESAFLLHEVIDLTNNLIGIRDEEWENPLTFDKLYVQGDTRKKILLIFSGMTPYGAILKVKERAEEILSDFRLESFRKKDFI